MCVPTWLCAPLQHQTLGLPGLPAWLGDPAGGQRHNLHPVVSAACTDQLPVGQAAGSAASFSWSGNMGGIGLESAHGPGPHPSLPLLQCARLLFKQCHRQRSLHPLVRLRGVRPTWGARARRCAAPATLCLPARCECTTDNRALLVCSPAGTYQDQAGQAVCNSCPAGTSTDDVGATNCTQCDSGTYRNSSQSESLAWLTDEAVLGCAS